MKKLLTLILAFTLIINAFALYSFAADEKYTALIIAKDGMFESCAEALDALYQITGDGLDIGEIYEKVFIGFSAEIDTALAERIHNSESFDVQLCGEFSPLETVEYDTLIEYASEMIRPYKNENGESIYTGKGVKVAVIDDGFDITHSAFASTPEQASFSREELEELYFGEELTLKTGEVMPEGLYVSEKIPYAYNYVSKNTDVSTLNNHGTHVAGIIGADCEELMGIAPDCQLFLMKTFSETTGTANEIYVMSALEDAINLGVDVVNLSIGTYSGFSEIGMMSVMGRVARSLERAGIVVNCAAGNDASIGSKSAYYRNHKIDLPLNTQTDYGTLNYPAVLESFTAVASAQNTQISDNVIIHSESSIEKRITYSDTNAELGLIKGTFVNHFDGQTLEYVDIPNNGAAADYRRLDVYGKIALVKRGEITFIEKVNNAARAGAVGVIVYNNSTTDTNIKMDITGCSIPAVLISAEDGEYLKNASRKEVIFSKELCGFKQNPDAYKMASYSSWGVTPELTLKPDITAVGHSVYSAAAGGHYTSLSGTSMATPMISGASAVICEKLKLEESKYILGKRPDYIKNLLMSSAKPLVNPDTNTEYSPRVQGSGLVDITGALSSELLIKDSENNPSLSLGDNIGNSFKINAVIENITDKDIEVTLDAVLIHDTVLKVSDAESQIEEAFNSLTQVPFENAQIKLENTNINRKDGGKSTLIIPADSSCEIELEVSLDEASLPTNDFPNGFFIDGFLYAKTNTGEYSMPFTGFYGSFASSDIFDSSGYSDYDKEPYLYGNLLLSMASGKYSVLGSNDQTINGEKLAKNIAFSPNGDKSFDTLYFTPSNLRNITGYEVSITDKDGELVYVEEHTEKMVKSDTSPQEFIEIWDGSDGLKLDYVFPDGEYIVTVTAKCNKNGTDSISLPVKIDTRPPELSGYEVKLVDGLKILEIKAYDDNKVRTAEFYSDGETVLEDIDDGDNVFSFDITEFDDKICWVDITDYAMNTKTEKIIVG